MLIGISGESLLGNMLAGKELIGADNGIIRDGHDFQCHCIL